MPNLSSILSHLEACLESATWRLSLAMGLGDIKAAGFYQAQIPFLIKQIRAVNELSNTLTKSKEA